MTEWQWTAAVIGAGVGNYLLRAAPFSFRAFRDFGRRYIRCLTYISFAVAAGIVSRSIFLSGGDLDLGRNAWIKVAAVAIALLLYRLKRNTPAALFLAVGIVMCLQWLLELLAP